MTEELPAPPPAEAPSEPSSEAAAPPPAPAPGSAGTIRIACRGHMTLALDELVDLQGDLKMLDEGEYQKLRGEILGGGFSFPVAVWPSPEGRYFLLDGHQRKRALTRMRDQEGYEIPPIPADPVESESFVAAMGKCLAGASQFGRMTLPGLARFSSEAGLSVEAMKTRFRLPEVDLGKLQEAITELTKVSAHERSSGGSSETKPQVSLADRFLIPPFSVINTREGWWQTRKRQWLSLGIQSELGRGGAPGGSPRPTGKLDENGKTQRDLTGRGGLLSPGQTREPGSEYEGGHAWVGAGTSIFDPVLAELIYRWFSPASGVVLDPFAGGSVRGVVASMLGRHYSGVELRPEQVEANRSQGATLCAQTPMPQWIVGDSREIPSLGGVPAEADLIFSCPPYADLEVYSDDPRDLSTLGYEDFRSAYFQIIAAAAERLRPNRFAVFVVGEARNAEGNYYGLVPDTVKAFERAGLHFYNEAILVTPAVSLALTARIPFETSRKLRKTHQNVLVFVKGDPRLATEACGPVDVSDALARMAEAGEPQ